MKRMKSAVKTASVVALAILFLARPVCAQNRQVPTGRTLLLSLASAAQNLERGAWNTGRIEESVTWGAWALLYRQQAAQLPPSLSAVSLAASAAQGARQLYSKAVASGNQPYARLARASGLFWKDIAGQLQRGQTRLSVSFPREMLIPVPDAPGTPWAAAPGSSYSPQQPANGGNTGGRAAQRVCYDCGGAGRRVCFTCKGTGWEDYTAFAGFPHPTDGYKDSRYRCTSCGGSGFKTCLTCGGAKVLNR